MDTQQIEAAVKLIVDVPAQLAKRWEAFLAQLEEPEQVVWLLLTLQHFLNGDNGMAAEAAEWVYWKTECRGCQFVEFGVCVKALYKGMVISKKPS